MKEKEGVSPLSILILRIAVTGIFINAGISHLVNSSKTVARLQQSPFLELLGKLASLESQVLMSGYVMIVFGVTFLLGIYTRWSALILFLILVPITLTIQSGAGLLHGPLWKNVAIGGGLLFFILNNPQAYSLFNPKKQYHD